MFEGLFSLLNLSHDCLLSVLQLADRLVDFTNDLIVQLLPFERLLQKPNQIELL